MKTKLLSIPIIFIIFTAFISATYFPENKFNSRDKTDAIFTKVRVEPKLIETVKVEIRKQIPGTHVRRIISGADEDQTLMVMYHPSGNFRESINKFFLIIDQMNGVISTQTFLGTTEETPDTFPSDYLIGWQFIKFDNMQRISKLTTLTKTLHADPDVLEVASLTNSSFDMVVVYKFSGESISKIEINKNRIRSLIGNQGVINVVEHHCP